MSQQPGRFWRFRNRSVALIKTFSAPADKRKAQGFIKRTGVSAAGMGAAYFIATTPAMAAIPFLMTLGPFVAGGAGLVAGFMAWRSYKDLNRSLTVSRHMSDAKQKWVEKKSRPPLLKRIGASIGNGLAATGRVITAPLRWRPFGKKSANTQDAPKQLEGTPARTLDGNASITADLNKAADAASGGMSAERQAAAARRTAARQQHNSNRF